MINCDTCNSEKIIYKLSGIPPELEEVAERYGHHKLELLGCCPDLQEDRPWCTECEQWVEEADSESKETNSSEESFTDEDGDTYVGESKDGLAHGLGTCTYKDGGVIAGRWRAGKPNGKVTKTLPDGTMYKGMVKNGIPHGKGELKDPSYSIEYKGLFKNGEYHGQGVLRIYINSIEIIFKGEFKNSMLNGQGSVASLGYKYIGEFKDNMKHGEGAEFEDDEQLIGVWADDEYIGPWGTELPDENKKKTPSKKKRHISKSKIVNLDGSKYIGIKKSTKK